MSKPRVAVAMSGGVDSAVAAFLAQRAGYEVTGINLQMFDQAPDTQLTECCEMLGIKLVRFDCRKEFFSRVISASAQEYAAGRTPNPCCDCNKVLKFAELFRAAESCGIGTVFTGHYVRRLCDAGGKFFLAKGADARKDQSYFLYRLSQNELQKTGFPLGELVKDEVRRIAREAGLPCAARPDSQDACFQIAGECCGETLRRLCGMPVKRGHFIHNGKKVGFHSGIHRYTLGQRNGLNVALGVPAYISEIDAESGNITLTTDQRELLDEKFTVRQVNWCSGLPPDETADLTVRVRYRSPGVRCEISGGGESLTVTPAEPLRAVTPGQAAVFYDGERLLGGGIIDRVQKLEKKDV